MNKISKILKIYKNSTEEIIPKEWNVKRLSQLGTIYSGGTPDTENKEYWDGNIFWCTPSDITQLQSKYIQSTENKITNKGLQNSSATLLPIKSIIVCTRATIGNAAITNIELATNQGFKNIIPNKCNTEWLFYSIIFNKLKLKRLGCGSTFLEISKKDFENFKLLAPPLEEQKKIAEILSTWDEAIEKQSKLIEKLELRKRGIMQRLLTGRTRLPGFTTSWQKMKLGDICKETTIKNTKNAKYIVLSCTKYKGLVSSLEYFGKQIFSNDLKQYKIVPKNHFAYATNHIEEGSIGYQIDYDYSLISPMYTVFKTNENKINNHFLYALLKTPLMMYNYKSRIEGSIDRRGGLRYNTFAKIPILLPTLNEQNAISKILTTIDGEINIQHKKLETLRTQKRGLMQQLLTGKTRVKI